MRQLEQMVLPTGRACSSRCAYPLTSSVLFLAVRGVFQEIYVRIVMYCMVCKVRDGTVGCNGGSSGVDFAGL